MRTEVKKALSEEVKGRFGANPLGGGRGGRRGEGGEGGGRGARACVRACTRRLTCPLLPNVNLVK
jgi:hypothetical protein